MRFISSPGRQVSWRARAILFEADAVADTIEFIGQQIKMAKPDIVDTEAVITPASGLKRPVEGTLGSPFGMRFRRLHSGIDVRAPYGTPVAAAAAGKVILCDDLGPYGNTIVLDHHGGLATVYAHLTGIIPVQNASVRAGEIIGYIGTTGRSSGSHLHFEVRVHGSPVDPDVYLQAQGLN